MIYPTISEYIESIKYAEENFATLTNLRPVLDDEGLPIMSSGNFAVVFKMQDITDNKFHALKCFTKDQEGRDEAYKLITEELDKVDSPYIVPTQYLESELYVNTKLSGQNEFPVVVMNWVEGMPMETYIEQNKDDRYAIHRLFGSFCQMSLWLLSQSFAHGDLKPDNILICKDGSIVLVDYDGMFVPAMKYKKPRELGSPDFRHPLRTKFEFNDMIDVFAISSIALSLSYIAKCFDKDSFNYTSSFFLKEKDIVSPQESIILRDIQSKCIDNICGKMLSIFFFALSDKEVSKNLISTQLSSVINDYTNSTKFDRSNSFTINEIEYSFDGRKIINVNSPSQLFEIREGVEVLCDDCIRYDYKISILVIPSSLKVVGNGAFPWEVHHFISKSSSFVVSECGLFTADRSELIQCNAQYTKSILSVYPETTIVRTRAYRSTDTYTPFIVKDNVYYRLLPDGADNMTVGEKVEPLFEDDNGAVYSKDKKTLYHFPIVSRIKEYVINDGCERIVADAFEYVVEVCAGGHGDVDVWIGGNQIETIHLPSSLKRIEHNALLGCINLRNIFINIYDELEVKSLLETYTEEDYGSRRIKLGCGMFIYETNCTDQDKNDAITDQDGFTYSKDGLKLLHANHIDSKYTVKEGVKIICDEAFYLIDCQNVILPESLVSIGNVSFADCGIDQITIPSNVKSIGDCAFMGGVTSIRINGAIQYMGAEVFSSGIEGSCLEKIELSDGILDLGNLTFKGCNNLQSITLPPSIMSMGDNPFAFSGVRHIENKSENYEIKNNCLYKKWSSKLISYFGTEHDFTIDDNFKEIGNYAFAGNKYIEGIALPDRTRTIGDYSFYRCENLQYIDLPNALISIGRSAFQSCFKLDDIELPQSIHEVKDFTFNACSSLSSILLPEFLLKIGKSAFWQCLSLTHITLPKFLNSIVENAFEKDYNGNGVSDIRCDNNMNFNTFNGCLYETKTKTLVAAFSNQEIINIKDGTEFIGNNAFQYCKELKYVSIPLSVKSIGDSSFWGCDKLQYVVFDKNVDSIEHPNTLFAFCNSLQHIYIKNNDKVFDLLFNANEDYRLILEKVDDTTVLQYDYEDTFIIENEKYTYYDHKHRIISYGDTYRSDYFIKEGTEIICDNCFNDLYSEFDSLYLSKLHIPKSVKKIGKNVFCGSLEEIICDSPFFKIENHSLLSTDGKVFYRYFGKEKDFIIPDSVEIIVGGAFSGLYLNSIVIPPSVKEIGENPFAGTFKSIEESELDLYCQSPMFEIRQNCLIEINTKHLIAYLKNEEEIILDDISSIGANAFYAKNCKHIKISSQITHIDEYAFGWCFQLESIIVPQNDYTSTHGFSCVPYLKFE